MRKAQFAKVLAAFAAAAGLGIASAANAANAANAAIPPGYGLLGGVNEAHYCGQYARLSDGSDVGMTAVAKGGNWDCTITITIPSPPGGSFTVTRAINQTDACRNQYTVSPVPVALNPDPGNPNTWGCYQK